MNEVMVATQDLTDAELRTSIQRLRTEGKAEEADQAQAFLDIGPIGERRKFWDYFQNGRLPELIEQPATGDDPEDTYFVRLNAATEKQVLAALTVETGARRAIIGRMHNLLRTIFIHSPEITVDEARKRFRQKADSLTVGQI